MNPPYLIIIIGLIFYSFLFIHISKNVVLVIVGVLMGLCSGVIYYIIYMPIISLGENNIYLAFLILFFFISGINSFFEEFFKVITIYLYLKYRQVSVREVLCLGAAVGLGFVTLESIKHMGSIPDRTLLRMVIPMHQILTMLSSYGVFKYQDTKKRRWLGLLILSSYIHIIINKIFNVIMT